MATLPVVVPDRELPEYLPARMVNEFVYCPRLFFYEWVEGIFRESSDTLEGSQQHKRVDKEGKGLPASDDLPEDLKTRAVTLSSELYRVIATIDLLEVTDGVVVPVDYKRGRPREEEGGLEMWPSDRVQLALQALILRENGYRCDEAIVYYAATKQRVRLRIDDGVVTETLTAVREAWSAAKRGVLPPPLEDSPKCPGCSLVGICLPGETNALLRGEIEDSDGQMALFDTGLLPKKRPHMEVRRLVTPRSELKAAYLNTQGLRVGKSGDVLQVKEKDVLRQEIRMKEISQLNVMGNIQVSTQAVQALAEAEIPVCYFSQGGWFYGITAGLSTKNVFLRKAQFKLAEEEWFCLRLARKLVAGKVLENVEVGLDPSKLADDWSSLELAVSTWLKSRHMNQLTLEIYNPKTDNLVSRWDLDVIYGYGSDETFWVDTAAIRYSIAKAGLVASQCKYRFMIFNSQAVQTFRDGVRAVSGQPKDSVATALEQRLAEMESAQEISYWKKV